MESKIKKIIASKTTWIGFLLIIFLLSLAWFFRYEHIAPNGAQIIYQINRITGDVKLIHRNNIYPASQIK